MHVSDFSSSSERKLQQIVDILVKTYGMSQDAFLDEAAASDALKSYEQLRQHALYEGVQSREYTKFVLITEALRIYLYEIAPKRRKTIRRK
jgi:hypothetical protein